MPNQFIFKVLLLSGVMAVQLPGIAAQAQNLDSTVRGEVQINRNSEQSQQRVSTLAIGLP